MAKFTGHTITSDSALGAAKIQRSLRFNTADADYLNRTIGTPTSSQIFTFSCWLKTTKLDGDGKSIFLAQGSSQSGADQILTLDSDNELFFQGSDSGIYGRWEGNGVLKNTSAWYHIVVKVDTTVGTNGVTFYVNNEVASGTWVTTLPQNKSFSGSANGATHHVGKGLSSYPSQQAFSGYLAEVNFIDGQALDSSYFGFTDPVTNIWMPKRYEGTYGTNGFYLDFSDNSSTAALGIDKSPNGNDFTLNNLATGDSVLDTPSNNFSTLRYFTGPASSGSSLSEGNLKFITGSSGSARNLNRMGISTFLPTSGKWYVEVRVLDSNGQNFIGVSSYQVELLQTVNNTRYAFVYSSDGDKYVRTAGSESISTYASSYTLNDIIGIYVDMDISTPRVYFSKNGQWANGTGAWNQANPSGYIELGDTFFTESTGGNLGIGFLVSSGSGGTSATYQFNFGQDSTFSGATTAGGNTDDRGIGDFKYPVPSDALALCSVNLPLTTSSVVRPKKHFDTVLFTGNGSTGQSITSLEFQPDLIWLKNRSGTNNHAMVNSVIGRAKGLYPDSNSAEFNSSAGRDLASFDISGFTVGEPEQASSTNNNGSNIVAWCWKAGGAAVANTDGSINTQVSANQEAGFSIVTWTGNGSSGATLGHGLGAAPKFIITKRRAASSHWATFHDSLGTGSEVYLDLSQQKTDSNFWVSSPTSSVFTVSAADYVNQSSDTYIAFCWAEIPGYSRFGVYRGNGQSEGKFVDCGFKPAFLIIKRVNAARNWMIFDSKRDPDNPVQTFLEADQTSTDATLNGGVLFLANGFKCITSDTDVNANDTSGGDTYIYMAYAEQPGTTSFDTFPNAR